MKQAALTLILFLALGASGCSTGFETGNSPLSSTEKNDVSSDSSFHSEASSESKPSSQISSEDVEEGGDGAKVFATYEFRDANDFISFYQRFKKHNSTRFVFPIFEFLNPQFRMSYIFTSEGVDLDDYQKKNYDIKFPAPNLKLEFSYKDDSTIGVVRNFFVSGSSADISMLSSASHMRFTVSSDTFTVEFDGVPHSAFIGKVTSNHLEQSKINTFADLLQDGFKEGFRYAF